jgi:HlyD family secretion protein
MARGQKERAIGALQEAETADQERYIVAPGHEYRNDYLKPGRLAAGYTLFKGYITSSIYFRFTIPENQLDKVKKGQEINIHIPYKNKDIRNCHYHKTIGCL